MDECIILCIGQALHEVIRLSMDGEWQNSIASLTEFERTHSNHKLSMILLDATTQLNDGQKAKAVNDCILAINGHHSKNSKAELMQRLKNAETAEEKRKIMQELQNMIKRG